MQGIEDFDTKDEIFCRCENVFGVPLDVLATAYSDPDVVSRHGLRGTGENEPVAVAGTYGRGRTFNYLLGHVWPFYTGHGLGEKGMFPDRMCSTLRTRATRWPAQAAIVIADSDPELAFRCVQAAREDFQFAKARFAKRGMERPVMWEHTLRRE